jgi:DNA polymerase-1
MSFVLPNIRKIFIPDPGYVLFEADLKGADAQVVAKEAGDLDLLDDFRLKKDIYTLEATYAWGSKWELFTPSQRKAQRQNFKSCVHGTDYGASAKTLANNLSLPIAITEKFQRHWFELHPGVRSWQKRVERGLNTNRQARNPFGYRIIYFDRIEGLLPQALAWIPQSTVAETCFRGAIRLCDECPWVEPLLQVHDSIVFQVPFVHAERIEKITEALQVEIPYPDSPLVIPWDLKRSEKSWGDCEKVSLT